MRILAFAILAIGTVSIGPTAAQMYDPNFPVCMHVWKQGANYYDCSFTTLSQCNASASGRAAGCVTSIRILRARECLRDDIIAVSTKIVSRHSTEIESFRQSWSPALPSLQGALPLRLDRRDHRACPLSPAAAIPTPTKKLG
jgi:hypothetical protein